VSGQGDHARTVGDPGGEAWAVSGPPEGEVRAAGTGEPANERQPASDHEPAGVEEPLLDIRAVGKTFGATVALEHLDLQVRPGELLTLLGPSGSGKTTLLKIVAGFESPTGGQVLLRGRDISRLAPARRGVGMVFQHYALFPHMTVAQNLAYGLKVRRRPRPERERRVEQLIDLLQLAGLADRYPRQLSGGQQQRVALGRALAYDPEIVLMDEPLGALDRTLRIEMEAEIRRLHRDLGTTIVYVTHDQQEALALSDRIAILRGGRLVGLGTPEHLFRRPANSFVAEFFAGANLLAVAGHELDADGGARVRCAGVEIRCPTTAPAGGRALLAVRRRSLRRHPSEGALTLRGVLTEARLLGDARELTLEIPDLGSVVAVMDAADCEDLRVGGHTELYVPAGEPVLVPLL
jgi:putative spermidine/putrescine transport system ATP-binding protein